MLKSGVFGICCVCATLAAQTYVPQNVGEFSIRSLVRLRG